MKVKVFSTLEPSEKGNRLGRVFDYSIIFLIVLSTTLSGMATVKGISKDFLTFINAVESFVVIVFIVEYIMRVWTSNLKLGFSGKIKGRIKYIFTPLALIDLLAISPFFLFPLLSVDLIFLRTIRLLQLMRVFKLTRYTQSFDYIIDVVKYKKNDLVVTFVAIFVILVLVSGIIYHFEHEAQPDKFPDVPSSLWWTIITLTTVGYGDVVPITTGGKVFGGLIALLGIGFFALPAGILASGFTEKRRIVQNKVKKI